MTDIASIALLRERLQPQGTAKVVRLGFMNGGAFYKEEFVQGCLDEIENIIMRKVLGEDPTKLEILAIQLLLESGYFKSFEEVEAALLADKLRRERNGQ